MKFKKTSKLLLIGVTLCGSQNLVLANEMEHHPKPLLSVADVDGDGLVTHVDVDMIINSMKLGKYVALHDMNADGIVDKHDKKFAKKNIGEVSTLLDQELAGLYNRFAELQDKDGAYLRKYYYIPDARSRKGHGAHWGTPAGRTSYTPTGTFNMNKYEGLNVPADESRIEALFYTQGSIPLFLHREISIETFYEEIDALITDASSEAEKMQLRMTAWTNYVDPSNGGYYPNSTDETWKNLRIIGFKHTEDDGLGRQHPPKAFQGAPTIEDFMADPNNVDLRDVEMWHTHAGMCYYIDSDTGVGTLLQHRTYNECQALNPGGYRLIGIDSNGQAIFGNAWANIWMMHLWIYTLSSDGVFSGVRPGLDEDVGLSECEVNGGRRVPYYFHMSDNHDNGSCGEPTP